MIRLVEVDLCAEPDDLGPVAGHVWVLVRAGDEPLGEVRLADVDPLDWPMIRAGLADRFAALLWARDAVVPASPQQGLPTEDLTIVVCTRDRPAMLEGCLRALLALDPPCGEVLVVDNAPTGPGTAEVCERLGVRRVVEPEAGLDRARNRGWREAATPVVAYVDDDARADRRFAASLARGFVGREVACVTGLVLPHEVQTTPQLRFEVEEGGMRKGFERRLFSRHISPVGLQAYRLGVGTNMAFRRRVLQELGGFDPRLDVGTSTRGGGDLDMLWRVVEAGHVIAYEPSAIVRHIHRRTRAQLLAQLRDNGVAFSAFLALRASESPELAAAVRRERRRWHWERHVRRSLVAIRDRKPLPLALALYELAGSRHGAAALEAETTRVHGGRQGVPA